jgi:hypothetical protein
MRAWSFYIFFGFILPPAILPGQSSYDVSRLETLAMIFEAKGGGLFFPAVLEEFHTSINNLNGYSPGVHEPDLDDEYEKIENHLLSWITVAERTQKFLVSVLDTRQSSLLIGADGFAAQTFFQGERKLKEAAYHFQNNNLSHAEFSAGEARKYYQTAEIETIRNNLLGEVRITLRECADLGAEKYAPKTFAKTQELLSQVEELASDRTPNYYLLSPKSSELYKTAQQLYTIVKVTRPIYQAENNAEEYILRLGERITKLSEALKYAGEEDKAWEELLDDLVFQVQNLMEEKNRLEHRNRQLEEEKQTLEKELLSFKNLADQRLFLERKINHVKTILSGGVKEQGTFLILQLDSLAFAENEHQVTPQNAARLAKMVEALREFPNYPYIIRYIQYSAENVLQDQVLANLRAAAIKEFIQSHLLFADNPVEALGVVYKTDEQKEKTSLSQMEILIDFKFYLTFDADHPVYKAD